LQSYHPRKPDTKRNIIVYANFEDYASCPQLACTDDCLMLLFQDQNPVKLCTSDKHPHYQPVALPPPASQRHPPSGLRLLGVGRE
jgi:hypothetical protein